MNNNKINIKNNLLDNSTDSGKVTILLITLGVLLIIFVAIMGYINYKRYNQYKIQDFVEEELLKTIHNCLLTSNSIRPAFGFSSSIIRLCILLTLHLQIYRVKNAISTCLR